MMHDFCIAECVFAVGRHWPVGTARGASLCRSGAERADCLVVLGPRTSPQPRTHAGVAGGCAGLLKGFAHATESRAPASGVAPTAWCAATPSARDCKQNGADTRRAGPGLGIALAEVPMTAMGRLRPAAFQTVQSRSISDRQRINIDGPAQQAFSVRPLAQAVQYAVPGAQECL